MGNLVGFAFIFIFLCQFKILSRSKKFYNEFQSNNYGIFFDLVCIQAIKKFAEVRPPGIYKNDYIEALYSFYHEKRPDSGPDAFSCPLTPEWKKELDLNGEAVPDDDDDGVSAAPLHVCIP